MEANKKKDTTKKSLHPENRHREPYNFKELIVACPELKPFVSLNKYNTPSIDFFNPLAVKWLNKALLKKHYNIQHWDIPEGYLCPPIPGRADYLHYIADFFEKGKKLHCLDIGVGANCIYPLLGHSLFGNTFVGSEIDPIAFETASTIVSKNPHLSKHVEIRFQKSSEHMFSGIIKSNEKFDICLCNPPFHASASDAFKATNRKQKNLNSPNKALNFGGKSNELWCPGGELKFISNLILQSNQYKNNVSFFSSLISKESNVIKIKKLLKKVEAKKVTFIDMATGNKKSRIVIWTF